jgi:GDP-L-fucose synthase
VFDSSRPDGTPRKLLDVSKLTSMGWKPSLALEDGVRDTWQWYQQHAIVTCS